jgi:hypothetical protein
MVIFHRSPRRSARPVSARYTPFIRHLLGEPRNPPGDTLPQLRPFHSEEQPQHPISADRPDEFSQRAIDEQQARKPEINDPEMRPDGLVDDARDRLSKTSVFDGKWNEMFREANEKSC